MTIVHRTTKQDVDGLKDEIDSILAACSELTEDQRAKAIEEAESIIAEVVEDREHPHRLSVRLEGTQIWLLAQALLDYRDAYIGGMAIQMALVKDAERRLSALVSERTDSTDWRDLAHEGFLQLEYLHERERKHGSTEALLLRMSEKLGLPSDHATRTEREGKV